MKTAFITGGSKGLGLGFVQVLLEEGYHVFASYRHEIGMVTHEQLEWIPLEVTDDASIARAVKTVSDKVHTIDLLINNAGVNKDTLGLGIESVSTLTNLERKAMLQMMDINAVSPILVVKHFLPLLNGVPSFVINISSCRASLHDPEPCEYANFGYRGSKAALVVMTRALVHDLPHNIKTFSVHPGNIKGNTSPHGTHEAPVQAEKILSILEKFDESMHGAFLNYHGTPYPL